MTACPPAPRLPALLDRLEAVYGRPRREPPCTALEWILWENCAYLVSDARRAEAYRALAERTKLEPARILGLAHEELAELAALGGMHPERRVEKLRSIAETVQESFDGDLEAATKRPLREARRALKRFPGIGDPGTDKILLFTGRHVVPALESNGLRVLVRLGLAEEAKNYTATYRNAIAALEPFAERGGAWLVRAHQLLRSHGQALCKNNAPLCDDCPLAERCPSAE